MFKILRADRPNIDAYTSGPDCILEEFLYLGDIEATEECTLKEFGIDYVISIGEHNMIKNGPFPYVKEHLIIVANDDETQDLTNAFRESFEFIEKYKSNKILVHCSAGMSRSASIVIGYLIIYHNLDFEKAYHYVLSRRPCIYPNDGFIKQLMSLK